MRTFLEKRLSLSAIGTGLVCVAVGSIAGGFGNYFPPDFRSDFLLGRQAYFYGSYRWAFYTHILAGPISLLAGLVLLSTSARQAFPKAHRLLGRAQVFLVFLVALSGLWMAWYAPGGHLTVAGFATLALVTAVCTGMGWREARWRRLDAHRRWMKRCYALLASAVVLRLMGGLADELNLDGTYPLAAWLSWLLPLAVLEIQALTAPGSHHR